MPPSAANFDMHQARRDLASLSQEWRTNIQEAFSLIDAQGNGFLSSREWPFALQALGFHLPKPETYTLLCAHGVVPDDFDQQQQQCPPVRYRITLEVFEAIAAWLIVRRDPTEAAEEAWTLFDPRNSGRITVDSLRSVCAEVNSPLSDADLRKMIDALDLTGKGWVSKDEFIDMARGSQWDRKA
ncbi:centrin-3 [Plectosphaerella cucumerina]|jgi:centrin-3|uniref:Centrin-3 n=1 Tax=Plectosphaerella cucumerina TaxID=40658 RepID=A0A8K0TS12_9PEZI|nr:centrin-3 [Plectosphaerella cucumerina]